MYVYKCDFTYVYAVYVMLSSMAEDVENCIVGTFYTSS